MDSGPSSVQRSAKEQARSSIDNGLDCTKQSTEFLNNLRQQNPDKWTMPNEWHSRRVCSQHDHEIDFSPVTITIPQHWRERLQIPNTIPTQFSVSPADIEAMAKSTMQRKLGGSMFRNSKYWLQVMPNTPSATAMKEGGVKWRLISQTRRRKRHRRPPRMPATNKERLTIWTRAMQLLEAGVLEPIPEQEAPVMHGGIEVPTITASSFCEEKPSSDPNAEKRYRFLTDEKSSGTNDQSKTNKFRQEGMEEVHTMTKPGDLYLSFDFSDAYAQTLVLEHLRRMLQTELSEPDEHGNHKRSVTLRYTGLTQGLATSPERFTKLLRCPLRVLRSLGLRIVHKIDDLLLIVSTLYEARLHGWVLVWFFKELGCIFNSPKGEYAGQVRIKWHGFMRCSITMITFMPGDKCTRIVQLACMFGTLMIHGGTFTLKLLAGVIGTMMAGIHGISSVRLHQLQLSRLRLWVMKSPNWDWTTNYTVATVPSELRQAVATELKWWVRDYNKHTPELIHWNGKHHHNRKPTVKIYSDACNYQWGYWVAKTDQFPELNIKRPFSGDQLNWHITLQETYAAAQAVIEVARLRNLKDCSILARSDATTTVHYVKCSGGKKMAHAMAIVPMEEECLARRISVTCFHIAGENNPGDAPSRDLVGVAQYKMHEAVFAAAHQQWGPIAGDLFAAQWNNQAARYATYEWGDSKAVAHDAFTMDWTPGLWWAFPPPQKQMLNKVVQRTLAEGANIVLVTPLWKIEAVVTALQHLVAHPLVLEVNKDLLQCPDAYRLNEEAKKMNKARPQWWTRVPYKHMIVMNMCGKGSCKGKYLRELQLDAEQCTSPEKMARKVERTLLANGKDLLPDLTKNVEGARMLSEMLTLLMTQPNKKKESHGQ